MKVRKGHSYNDLLEQSAMNELLPDFKGKCILDLGCGYGLNSKRFIDLGADEVVAIDISSNMIDLAKKENNRKNIIYKVMAMEDIDELEEGFDLVYSSLAFHYIEDFDTSVKNIYNLLNDGGVLLFSQEHPFVTASYNSEGHYLCDEAGDYKFYAFKDYSDIGKRSGEWFVDDVINYHRTFSSLINTLTHHKFSIVSVVEPLPSEKAL